MEIVGGDWARIGQIGIVFAMTLAALVLLPSAELRAWLRVIARQAFVRASLRLSPGMAALHRDGRPRRREAGARSSERVVKALADIAERPGGLLLALRRARPAVAARGALELDSGRARGGDGAEAAAAPARSRRATSIDFDAIRDGWLASSGETRRRCPPGCAAMREAWAGVPLIQTAGWSGSSCSRIRRCRRPLDWEDFDLLRTAGIQAASYLAEARSQEALADAQRFDEFNRRFAFILHDIKNLVSQLSLVARNAERHADNPEFRADMIATLQSSVGKMNDLLARLVAAAAQRGGRAAAADRGAAAARGDRRGEAPRRIRSRSPAMPTLGRSADPAALEQALGHLVQNAIEASPRRAPVDHARRAESGGDVAIDVDRPRPRHVGRLHPQPAVPALRLDQGSAASASAPIEARALIARDGRPARRRQPAKARAPRFTIYLPAAADRPLADLRTETRMNAPTHKPKLLVVEDDEGLQRQLTGPMTIMRCWSPPTAPPRSTRCAPHEPAVVTLDLGLPPDPDGVSEGFAALETILTLKPDTKVIVASGHGARESALRAIALGRL